MAATLSLQLKVVVIILLSFAARLMLASGLDLFPDEFLYAYLADHRLANFSPHPPGVPLMVKLGTYVFGRNEIGARILSLVFSTLTALPVYHLGRTLSGHRAGLLAALIVSLVPLYFITGTIITPDATHVFAAALFLSFLVRAISLSSTLTWCVAGLTLGLGLYVKYMLILLVPALLFSIAVSPPLRKELRRPGLYMMLIIAFLVFVPVAAWYESQAGWPALKYHLQDRQSPVSPSLSAFAAYQGMHLLLYSPLLFPLLISSAIAGVVSRRRMHQPLDFLLGVCALLPFLFFTLTATVTERHLSREQWDAIAYIPAIVLMASYLTKGSGAFPRVLNRLWKPALLLSATTIVLAALEAGTASLSALIGRAPAFLGPVGWKQLSTRIDDAIGAMPSRKTPFLLGDSFQPVLAYNFYGKHRIPLYMLDSDKQHEYGIQHIIVSLGLFQDHLVAEKANNAIFVMQEDVRQGEKQSQRVARRMAKIEGMFNTTTEAPPVEVSKGGRLAKRFRLLHCLNLQKMPWEASRADK